MANNVDRLSRNIHRIVERADIQIPPAPTFPVEAVTGPVSNRMAAVARFNADLKRWRNDRWSVDAPFVTEAELSRSITKVSDDQALLTVRFEVALQDLEELEARVTVLESTVTTLDTRVTILESEIDTAVPHTILDAVVHTDSVTKTVTRGALIYGNATPKWDLLTIGSLGTYVRSDGVDVAWSSVVATEITGTLGVTNGGTGATTLTGIIQGTGVVPLTGITGTANYVPKWSATAPFLTPTSLIYDSGTGVGINTNAPFSLLSNTNAVNAGATFAVVTDGLLWRTFGAGNYSVAIIAEPASGISLGLRVHTVGATSSDFPFVVSSGAGSGTIAIVVKGNGNVGIGLTAPTARFNVQQLFTGITTGSTTAIIENDTTMTGAGTTDISALSLILRFRGAVNQTDTNKGASGLILNAFNSNTATVTNFSGWRNDVRNISTGTVSNMQGIWIQDLLNTGGGSITNGYGIRINDITTATNNYGIGLAVSSGSLKYNVYAIGTAQNYFQGSVGIGIAVPLTKAHVFIIDAATITTTTVMTLEHASSGVPGISFGAQLLWSLESTLLGTDRDAGAINVAWTDATDATRTSAMFFRTTNTPGTMATQMTLSGAGGLSVGDAIATMPNGVVNVVTGFRVNLSATNGYVLMGNGTNIVLQALPVSTHTILDAAIHTDSVTQTVTRGSLIYGNATPKWDELVIGAAARVLRSDGTDISWSQVNLGTDVTQILPVSNGGTNKTAFTADSVIWFDGPAVSFQEDAGNFTYNSTTKLLTVTRTVGVTQSDTYGIGIVNTTAAIAGDPAGQQWSPPLRFEGQGWKTNATAGTQKVEFRQYIVPVQSTVSPTVYWLLEHSVNDAAYTELLRADSTGYVRITKDALGSIDTTLGQSVYGLQIQNATAATAGTTTQDAPTLIFKGAAWNSSALSSQDWRWRMLMKGVTVAGTTRSYVRLDSGNGGANFGNPIVFTSAGGLSVGAVIESAFGVVSAQVGYQIAGGATSGTFLRGNGTNFVQGSIAAGDLPGSFGGFANPTASVGLAVVNGVATTAMRSDAAPPLSVAIVPTWTGRHIWSYATLGVTPDDTKGISVVNSTAAAIGAQQLSPSFSWEGKGWGTGAGTSQAVRARSYILPVQGSSPTGILKIETSIAGAAYTDAMWLSLRTTFMVALGGPIYGLSHYSIGNPDAANSQYAQLFSNGDGSGRLTLGATGTGVSGSLFIQAGLATWVTLTPTGSLRIGDNTAPTNTSWVEVAAGTTVVAAINLVTGSLLTTPAAGALEYDGNFYATKLNNVRLGIGGSLAYSTTQTGNTALLETDLFTTSIAAGTGSSNGSVIESVSSGIFATSLSADKRIRAYWAGVLIFDSGNLNITTTQDWALYITVIRVDATNFKSIATLNTSSASLSAYADYASGASTWANANTLKVTGQGTNASDVVGEFFKVNFEM